jgi:nucleoside 2-deoxyribosyltransferase
VRLYLASPYGFSPATKTYYDAVVLPAVRAGGFDPLDPWEDPDGAVDRAFADAFALPAASERQDALRSLNRRIAAANVDRIRAADAVLAFLDGTDVDSGTAAEIGFAAALLKPVVGLRLDMRQTGDNEGTLVNLQVEYFLSATARTLDEALEALRNA